ncbi:MAG: hypothetical protein GF411_01225 [Candidatus Lokiarchaeota archaeon]|nr:hypothetical protein [Candidatus Lokiarchaeota archaeon]
MRLSRSRQLCLMYGLFVVMIFVGMSVPAQSQSFGSDWVEDSRLHIYLEINNRPIKQATESSPIVANLEGDLDLLLQMNVTNTVNLNTSGTLWFYYNGFPIIPIEIRNPITNSTWVELPYNNTIPVVEASIPMEQLLSLGGVVDIATGIYEASLNFTYFEVGDPTPYYLGAHFYILVPASLIDVVTSVTGIVATAGTVGAIAGSVGSIQALLDAIQTAHKVRGIQKKASEIRSLPNLAVLGALPVLMSVFSGLVSMSKRKKKKDEPDSYTPDDSTVSAYIVKERLKETAPEAWPKDNCPVDFKKWDKKENICKKCGIGESEARDAYAVYLSSKVEKAIKVIGKKKSINVRSLAKKIKTNDYNAGVIAAAMVDTEMTEIVKISTPFRSFVMNIAGLAFLVLTWQQLLGGAASEFQTTLTIVGAAFSLAVIVALYIARKTQVEKFRVEMGVSDEASISDSIDETSTDTSSSDNDEMNLEDISVEDEDIPEEE